MTVLLWISCECQLHPNSFVLLRNIKLKTKYMYSQIYRLITFKLLRKLKTSVTVLLQRQLTILPIFYH